MRNTIKKENKMIDLKLKYKEVVMLKTLVNNQLTTTKNLDPNTEKELVSLRSELMFHLNEFRMNNFINGNVLYPRKNRNI